MIDALEKASVELDPAFRDDTRFEDEEFKHQLKGSSGPYDNLDRKPVKFERVLKGMQEKMYYDLIATTPGSLIRDTQKKV